MKHQWFFTLGVVGVRESVGTRVVGMRSLISCMTGTFHIRLHYLYGIWFDVLCMPLHVHFRRGVALVGEFFYRALLIPLWDPPLRYKGCTGRQHADKAMFMKKVEIWP